MSDIAIRAEGLSKRYQLGSRERYQTLRDALAAPFRRRSRESSSEKNETFWALKDVSFEVKHGEVLGIIGRNGAGKSTLLKILSRITEPTEGQVSIHGRIASLLEVGTGFHPELTGRDNIYLNGAILGMKKAEIRRKFDEIVEFAEVDKFIDTPVKHYSSGMYVRLAFAVAAHLESEILVVDEVLAVGDIAFQNKCLGKMSDVAKAGRTVLFVTHNMLPVKNLCSRAILLGQGRVITDTPEVHHAISVYSGFNATGTSEWQRTARINKDSPPLLFTRLEQVLLGKQPYHKLQIVAELQSVRSHAPAFIAFEIVDATSVSLLQAIPRDTPFIDFSETAQRVVATINLPPLIPGTYQVTAWIGSHYAATFDEVAAAMTFRIVDSPQMNRSFPHFQSHGFMVSESSVVLERQCVEF